MELIDKRGKINKVTFRQIIKESNGHVHFKYANTLVDSTPSDMLVDLFSQDIPNCEDFDVFIIVNDKQYAFTGKDFNWFLKADRLSDLSKYIYGNDVFALDEAPDEQKETVSKVIKSIKPVKLIDMNSYHVATSFVNDKDKTIINDFTGLKSECIKWLNQQIVQRANVENEVDILICLDFDAAEQQWYTLKELFDAGKIEVC